MSRAALRLNGVPPLVLVAALSDSNGVCGVSDWLALGLDTEASKSEEGTQKKKTNDKNETIRNNNK
jgi:hypothetical protein